MLNIISFLKTYYENHSEIDRSYHTFHNIFVVYSLGQMKTSQHNKVIGRLLAGSVEDPLFL